MTFKITQYNSKPHAYKNHSYLIHKPKEGGHNKNILKQVFRSVETMLSHYPRVFVVRIDLHPKEFSVNNKMLSEFLKTYNKKLSVQYGSRVEFLVVREQNTSDKQHYHLAVSLNGAKVRSTNKLLPELKGAWEAFSGGSASFVESPSYMMKRGDKLSIDPVVYRLSYFAKTYTKEKNVGATNYLCTRTKYKESCFEDIDNDILFVDPNITLAYHQQSIAEQVVDSAVIVDEHLVSNNSYQNTAPNKRTPNTEFTFPHIRKCELAKLFPDKYKYQLRSFDWVVYCGQLILSPYLYSLNVLPFYKRLFERRHNNILP